jgi:isocitrate dehydrogenase (NAD+)
MRFILWLSDELCHSLDSIANSIAAATFDVINAGEVRTADMGGEWIVLSEYLYSNLVLGAATTSEFTAAVIKKL